MIVEYSAAVLGIWDALGPAVQDGLYVMALGLGVWLCFRVLRAMPTC